MPSPMTAGSTTTATRRAASATRQSLVSVSSTPSILLEPCSSCGAELDSCPERTSDRSTVEAQGRMGPVVNRP